MRKNALSPSLAAVVFLLLAAPASAEAQPAQTLPPAPPPAAAPADPNDLQPPSLATRVEARYPEEAKRKRLEANVGLELVIGEDGRVADAKVTSPAGNGFDE